ncbi:hypothetical protein JOE44_001001 [Chryseobacterium sp. PvR013]|uniref:hypothetical protein n=1 Tax=Chryseobacterium sp. PvR013 TaxID=2806595 RepID=UPI001AE4159D|nr:hypothetical protein [Chryseobacterium sp. PvR013]MBP1164117.1 hypothetical protein [Chryseobacterium sp. PvR013]
MWKNIHNYKFPFRYRNQYISNLDGKGYAAEALKGIIDFFVMICINIELQVP